MKNQKHNKTKTNSLLCLFRCAENGAPVLKAVHVHTLRVLFFIFLSLFSLKSFGEITFQYPTNWDINGTVIYENERKIGELTSKKSWPYKNGSKFIESFRKGFFDDPDSTKFVTSGQQGDVYWICRSSFFEGANGEYGVLYVRRFWVNGPILTLYSNESCTHELEAAIRIAESLIETNS